MPVSHMVPWAHASLPPTESQCVQSLIFIRTEKYEAAINKQEQQIGLYIYQHRLILNNSRLLEIIRDYQRNSCKAHDCDQHTDGQNHR